VASTPQPPRPAVPFRQAGAATHPNGHRFVSEAVCTQSQGKEMKSIFILAGVAALAVSSPALADPGHGHGNGHGNRGDYSYEYDRDCPPGLAKKHNGCMLPGQARKLARGERWRSGYGNYYSYQRIPYEVRRRYDLNQRYHYYYNDGYLYAVDPRTMMVQQVVNALLR